MAKYFVILPMLIGCLSPLQAGVSPDQALERHYDTYLSAALPFLAHGLARIDRTEIPVASDPYVRFAETRTYAGPDDQFRVWGRTVDSGEYEVEIRSRGNRAEARFARNGVEEYRIEVALSGGSNARPGIRSALKYRKDPTRDLRIQVRPQNGKGAHHPGAASLVVSMNGNRITETVWPGKKELESLPALEALLAEKRTSHIPLHNYFSLMLHSPDAVSRGLEVLEAAVAYSDLSRKEGRNGFSSKEIDGSEAYWCAVGTAGADLVTSALGSFGYSIVCGAVAEAS
jgi:hypothetical protein